MRVPLVRFNRERAGANVTPVEHWAAYARMSPRRVNVQFAESQNMAKRIAFVLGIMFGFLAFFTVTTIQEPHSELVKARMVEVGTLFLCIGLIWYGLQRS